MGIVCIYKRHTAQVLQVHTCTGYSGDQDVSKQPMVSYNTCAMLLRGYCLIFLLRRMELVAKVPGKLPAKVLGAFDLQRQYTQFTINTMVCDTATISRQIKHTNIVA